MLTITDHDTAASYSTTPDQLEQLAVSGVISGVSGDRNRIVRAHPNAFRPVEDTVD